MNASQRYDRTEKGRARSQRYEASEKGKAKHRRYRLTGANRINQRRHRERLIAKGLCNRCGKEPLCSETKCWSCLNDSEERSALAFG